MAVELERLMEENNKLNFHIKEFEDLRFSNSNLEQQVIDLTNKLKKMEYDFETVINEKEEILYRYEE